MKKKKNLERNKIKKREMRVLFAVYMNSSDTTPLLGLLDTLYRSL